MVCLVRIQNFVLWSQISMYTQRRVRLCSPLHFAVYLYESKFLCISFAFASDMVHFTFICLSVHLCIHNTSCVSCFSRWNMYPLEHYYFCFTSILLPSCQVRLILSVDDFSECNFYHFYNRDLTDHNTSSDLVVVVCCVKCCWLFVVQLSSSHHPSM